MGARLGTVRKSIDGVTLLRWVLVGGQAATIAISWPVWGSGFRPPLLPALPIPAFDVGWPLLASLLLVLVSPFVGATAHAVVLGLAIAMDQTRLQPEVVSIAILLFAVSGPRPLLGVGRAHLVTLWLWAGLAKLVSPAFYSVGGPWMFRGLPLPASLDSLGDYFGPVVIALELGAGIASIPVRTRRLGAGLGVAVHLGALVSLGPLGHSWNAAIWPWNVALAVAALTLIAPWSESLRSEFAHSGRLSRAVIAFLAVFPAAFYVGGADAYLSHHLYSWDTPGAVICDRKNRCSRDLSLLVLDAVRVPLPPEHRLYRGLFDRICEPGQTLRISETRWRYEGGDWKPQRSCPARAAAD